MWDIPYLSATSTVIVEDPIVVAAVKLRYFNRKPIGPNPACENHVKSKSGIQQFDATSKMLQNSI
jgi:hypothetical protein